MPNRKSRIGERSIAARARTSAIRETHDGRPLLLTRPGAVNWVTGGLSDPIDITASADPVWALEADQRRALITTVIEAPRLVHDFDPASSGWDVIGVPWYDPGAALRAAVDFARVSKDDLLSDIPSVGLDVTTDIVIARMVLSEPEQADLRALGAVVAGALDAGIDAWRPGMTTDFEVAGAVNQELERHGAKAVCLIVGGDERLRSLRHPLAIGDVVHDALMAVVVARRAGLHVAATRLAVRRANDPIVALVSQLESVEASVLRASNPGHTWGEAVETLATAYASIGHEGAWREHYQGGPIAFEQREFELAPGQSDSPFWDLACVPATAVAWNPSLRGGAKIEETYLIGKDGFEILTASGPRRERVRVIQ